MLCSRVGPAIILQNDSEFCAMRCEAAGFTAELDLKLFFKIIFVRHLRSVPDKINLRKSRQAQEQAKQKKGANIHMKPSTPT